MEYTEDGYVGGQVSEIITLIVGVGIAALVLIFVSVLGGSTYGLIEDDIAAISDANVQASVQSSAQAGFGAMETVGDYLPLIVLAIVIFIILGLIMGLGGSGQSGTSL
jgi:hypothetical protein